MAPARGKFWVFTLNNYTEEEKNFIDNLVNSETNLAYISYGKEMGDSGTPHLQGMLELHSRKRLSYVRDLIGRAHFEIRKGTFDECRDYCAKDGDFVEFGEQVSKGKGARSDLETLKNDLLAGATIKTVSENYFGNFLRYRRSIVAFKNLHGLQRSWKCSVIVYYGRTGSGKTQSVFENSTDLWVYPGNGWFDGYQGESQVLFDDFSGSEFKINYLLKLLDRYKMQVPVKGDFVHWVPTEIYLTSNLDPNVWYPNAHHEHVEALFRRITNKVCFD